MQLGLKHLILSGFCAFAIIGCSAAEKAALGDDDVHQIALQDVPADVSAVVMARAPGFDMVEVLEKRREGRIYYDVEGELPNGDEIEFDVLMTDNGPVVVEIQRDIPWTATPELVRNVVAGANSKNLKIARVIESQQADSDMIIYEVFAKGYPKRPRFEVSVAGDGPAELLETPWEH